MIRIAVVVLVAVLAMMIVTRRRQDDSGLDDWRWTVSDGPGGGVWREV